MGLMNKGDVRAWDRAGLLRLLRRVLPARGALVVPVLRWGRDLQTGHLTKGGGRALLKRLRRLERDGVIDLCRVEGYATLLRWHQDGQPDTPAAMLDSVLTDEEGWARSPYPGVYARLLLDSAKVMLRLARRRRP